MAFIVSPNMNLPLPVVGKEAGPDYAKDVNNSLTLVDQHDHSPGRGVLITTSGLNINADLPFNSNNATSLRSVRFTSQPSALVLPADVGILYEVGVNLYYNDGNGVVIPITASGGIAGTPGSIAGLTPPASATYIPGSKTFVWQSSASTAANLDAASVLFRNITPNSTNAVTLQAPPALGSNYILTLPYVPVSNSFMILDSSGNMSATIPVAGGLTRANLVPPGQQVSLSSGAFSTTSGAYVNVINLNLMITTTGNPVDLRFISDGVGGQISATSSSNAVTAQFRITRNGSQIATHFLATQATGASTSALTIPSSALNHIDVVTAGTYAYNVQVQVLAGVSGAAQVFNTKLLAYEIK
jgi:hypothetical protein